MKPDISIVIPLYNKEKYVRRTIDSILAQTLDNFECIIVDSSNDESKNIIRAYTDPRLIYHPFDKSTAAQARNHGAQFARSDLIAFLDADDEWQPDHLETLVRIRKKFPDAGLYSTPYVKIRPDGKPQVMLFVGIPKPPWEGYLADYLKICSRGDEPVHSSSCAVPCNIFQEMGGFPEKLKYGEDQYLWGIISLTYPVAYSWKGLTIYHTEALGRICDEKHIVYEHPFSTYLRKELAAGSIPPEKIRECRSYIRRKEISESFSRLLSGRETHPCSDTTTLTDALPKGSAGEGKKSRFPMKVIGTALGVFYHSSVHNILRRGLCLFYGCYNPPILLKNGKTGSRKL